MASTLRSIFAAGAKFRRALPFTEAMKSLKSESDPEKTAQILSHCSKSIRRRRSHLSSMLKLAKAGRPDLVDGIIRRQPHGNPEDRWIGLVSGDTNLTGNLRMIDIAVDAQSCLLTEKSLSSYVSFHLKQDMKKGASVYADKSSIRRLIKTLSDQIGVRPTASTHNVVLRAFVDRFDIGSALEWIKEMDSIWGIAPTVGSYNILLEALLKRGNSAGFNEVLMEIHRKGLQHNAATCSYWITMLSKTDELETAKDLLEEMINVNTIPTVATYTVLMDGFRRVRDLESVRKVFNLMSRRNRDAYCILLQAELDIGEYDSALDTCKEIMKRNKRRFPPLEYMRQLVKGLAEGTSGLPEKVMEVVERMKGRLKGKELKYWREVEFELYKTTNPLSSIFVNRFNSKKRS